MEGIINEKEMLKVLNNSKNVLLLEPNYIRQYKPLGFAKIASYIKERGGEVTYSRSVTFGDFDLICITTLFTNDSKIVLKTIGDCEQSIFLQGIPILIGGIFASLRAEYITKNSRQKVKVFPGYSKKLDDCLPDYSIDWKVDPPWDQAMITFTTRGCPNKCGYCMVWKMEPEFYIQPNWEKTITENDFEIAIVSDNNFLVAPLEHIERVAEVLAKCKKKVIFNNAVDVKLMTEKKADALAKITYMKDGRNGLRFAFDQMEDDGHYQKACKLMIKKLGVKSLSGMGLTYVLFNFTDTPQEAYYRVRECHKYGSNPYFMKYRPLTLLEKSNKYIGKHWTKNLVKAFGNWGSAYGYNTGDRKFETWAKNPDFDIKLTDEDWEKWYYKR